jgi:hypothetical protein
MVEKTESFVQKGLSVFSPPQERKKRKITSGQRFKWISG